jgi:fluoride exporter
VTLALLIGLAGGVGSALRYLVDQAVVRLLADRARGLPWATFVINVTGSFALGALTAAASTGALADDTRLVLGLGVCGGYTTFATAMVDTLRLGLAGRRGWLVVNLVGPLVCCVAAAGLGWWVGA